MNEMSGNIRTILAGEIMKQVQTSGNICFCSSYADGSWDITVTPTSVELAGYAAEHMTNTLEKEGLKLISREPYDQGSVFADPAKVLSYFSMSQLAQIYECGELAINKTSKNKIK